MQKQIPAQKQILGIDWKITHLKSKKCRKLVTCAMNLKNFGSTTHNLSTTITFCIDVSYKR